MITIEGLDAVPPEARGAFLALGNFDGVHRGHARLVGRLRALADAALTAAGNSLQDDATVLCVDWYGQHDEPRVVVSGAEPRLASSPLPSG